MKVFYCGTLAPAQSGWWHDLIHQGTHASTFVQDLQGRKDRWDRIGEIKRVNPLMWAFPQSRIVLREELAKAKKDSRLKARFCSFRLNLPSQDTATVLLAVEDFERMVARTVPPRQGRPVVGIDLGGGRAWSAGVGVWPNGRIEAMASAPGIPSIREQEIRDAVPSGTYSRLVDKGVLHVCQGKRVQPVEEIVAQVKAWNPQFMVADRFRQHELLDSNPGCPVQARISRWSESSEDIRGLRALALDGPLAIAPHSRALIQYSLSVSKVENDDSGNARLIKLGPNNCARDDVSSALVLAAGALSRAKPPRTVKCSVARGSR